MSTVLFKNATILDPNSPFHGKKRNVLVENGVIKTITDKEVNASNVVESSKLHLSPGWLDLRVSTGDPGFEHKEDLNTVVKAAAQGGFTSIAVLPNTNPTIQTKESITYILSKTKGAVVNVFPLGAISINNKGEELTEMIDMHHAGAKAFTDGNKPMWHSDLLLRALLYTQPLNTLLMIHAEDKYLSMGGQMHEGKTSTVLGLKGMPKLAEEIMVERDLSILQYTGGRIHFSHLSSPKSLELVKDAKRKGQKVTCDIAAYQLMLDDNLLTSFDTNLKVNPPLRNKKDIDSFWKYLADGTIDAIISDHCPQDSESKQLEFDLAEFGIIGLETAFAIACTANQKLELEQLVEKFSIQPRNILQVLQPVIKEGEKAELTAFDPTVQWTVEKKHIKSKSINTPFIGKNLKGKVLGIYNQKQFVPATI
jgi:dihydroorotase